MASIQQVLLHIVVQIRKIKIIPYLGILLSSLRCPPRSLDILAEDGFDSMMEVGI